MAHPVVPGDRGWYIPGTWHALQRNPRTGDFAWALGKKDFRGQTEEMDVRRTAEHLDFIRRHPAPEEEFKKLTLLRPLEKWPAIVRAITGDKVTLDVDSPQSGITLHYAGVPVDPQGVTPHSFQPQEDADGK